MTSQVDALFSSSVALTAGTPGVDVMGCRKGWVICLVVFMSLGRVPRTIQGSRFGSFVPMGSQLHFRAMSPESAQGGGAIAGVALNEL
jgi:hypothetical protein